MPVFIRFNQPKRLSMMGKTVFILAHPDDETIVGAGYLAQLGTLAKFRAISQLVAFANQFVKKLSLHFALSERSWIETPSIYYATLGEKGNHNGVRTNEPLEKIRREEVNQAAKILGARIEIDNIGDGKLENREQLLEQKILHFLRREQPDRVITFPPSGLTGHPDHKAVSRAATNAVRRFNQESKRSIELYYRVIDPDERGITGPFIHHDRLPITHQKRTILFRGKIRRTIEAHRTQVPEMGTIYPAFQRYAKRPQSPPEYRGKTTSIWKKETFHRIDDRQRRTDSVYNRERE